MEPTDEFDEQWLNTADPVTPIRKRLTRKRENGIPPEQEGNHAVTKKKAREQVVLRQYEFLDESQSEAEGEDDEEKEDWDDFLVDDGYGSEEVAAVRYNVRKAMGADTEESWREAFELLFHGQWKQFLDTALIKQKFGPVDSLLGSFNWGQRKETLRKFWHLAWDNRLSVKRYKTYQMGICVACALPRCLSYGIYSYSPDRVSLKKLGIMGSDCYDIKFEHVLNLVHCCRRISASLGRSDFHEYAMEELNNAIDPIIGACSAMRARYYGL